MKKYLLIPVLLLFVSFSYGQYDLKLKYGKVDTKDLEMTTYEKDPDAKAVVLGEKMFVSAQILHDDFILRYQYHVRIKVFDKSVFDDLGTIKIPYYSYRRGERITRIKAQTINLDENGKVTKTEVDKKDFFDDKMNKHISVKKFAFPNIQEGSILEFTYEMDSDYFTQINDFKFQDDIPVRWSSYKVRVPDFFAYRYDVQGTHPFTTQNEKRISLNLGPSYKAITGKEYNWVMTDIPALKPEPFITSMNDYYSAVKMRLSKFEPTWAIHENYITTWPALNQYYYEHIAQKTYLKEGNYNAAWKVAAGVVNSGQSELEKIASLYDFVQEKVNWNEVYEFDPDRSLDEVFKEGEGSNSEINLLLLALLREAGIQAFPMLVSPRSHGKPMNFLPYIGQFEQTLVVAIINEKAYFIDASNKDYPYDILPPDNLNIEGWMVVEEYKGQWIQINPSANKKIVMPKLKLNSDGTVTGAIQSVYKGYAACNQRSLLEEEGKEKYLHRTYSTYLESSNFENLNIEGTEKNAKQLKESVEIESDELAEATENIIYLNPIIQPFFEENPLKSEERTIPVDMAYSTDKQYIYNIELPEGFSVEELPEATKAELPNNGGFFMYVASQKGNTLQVICKLKITQTYYTPEEYKVLRNFIDLVVEKQNAQIVLTKA
jgi:transglutaminase-like putative cysteine protease